MRRFDALAEFGDERLAALTGDVLDQDLDAELQQLVTRASETLGLPVALVTLVLKRTQFFRAHVGLPPDLAAARATDRDASFCQFVVRDGARFEVTKASEDDRVPKDLVERYGIETYLGEPIRIGEVVVGSLCVAGSEPRVFSDADRDAIARLAAQVSARLDELARARQERPGLMSRATKPAFGELRNLLTSMTLNAETARVAAIELQPIVELVRRLPAGVYEQSPALGALGNSLDAVTSLRELLDEIADSAHRVTSTIRALQGFADDSGAAVRIGDVVTTASALAHHNTKLVGGTSWAPFDEGVCVLAARPVAISVLSATLSAISAAMRSSDDGIRGSVSVVDDDVLVVLAPANVGREELARCAATVAALVGRTPHVAVAAATDAAHVTLRFSAAPAAGTRDS